jgi:hypothetical protein
MFALWNKAMIIRGSTPEKITKVYRDNEPTFLLETSHVLDSAGLTFLGEPRLALTPPSSSAFRLR